LQRRRREHKNKEEKELADGLVFPARSTLSRVKKGCLGKVLMGNVLHLEKKREKAEGRKRGGNKGSR